MQQLRSNGASPDQRSAGKRANVFPLFFISIDELNKADAPPIPETSIHLLSVQGLTSFFNGLTGYTILLQHPRSPKNHTQVKTERAGTGPGHKLRLCAMLNALAPLSLLLTTNLSDSVFDDDVGAMQTLARPEGFLACLRHVTRS
jgi:hypothetical protein